jgi:hypothetical protein
MKCFTKGRNESKEARNEKRKCVFPCLLSALVSLLAVLPSYACPLCKESITGGMAKGFSLGTLLMLGVPILLVAVISGVVVKAYRQAQLRKH